MSAVFDEFDRPTSLAQRLDAELRHAHPSTILRAAIEEFGDELALVSSFGAESAVLLPMAAQIKPDGSQPLELARVDSFGYSRFNLQALFALATLGEHVGVDLWHFEAADGASIRKALDFLVPYAQDTSKPWPFEHGKKSSRDLSVLSRQAQAVYGESRYGNLLRTTPENSSAREGLFFHE